MIQEVVFSKAPDTATAVTELCSQLKKDVSHYNLIIFFASSSYDFPTLAAELHKRFADAEVIGATTSGEISSENGFSKNSVVLNAISDAHTRCKGILLDDVDKFPIVYKNKIIKAANDAGVQLTSSSASRDSFAITLICGLLNAEEGSLSLLYSLIKDPAFLVAGGSAGDDLKFKATYVSHNGQCSTHGAVILFVHTTRPFLIYKENIFQKSGKNVMLTDVDPETHTIRSIDNKNPRRRYAEVLGISESKAGDAILDHPFGRVFGDNIFIASLIQFAQDGTLTMYARVLQDSQQEILEPIDSVITAEQTCKEIQEKIPRPSCVIFFNCILRTLGFEAKHQIDSISSIWKRYFPVMSGFSTYGEQYGHINSNQTLVALVMGE